MSVPELSDDDRRAALDKAIAARRARAALKQQLRDGELTLADALARADEDEVLGKTRVFEVLESIPRIGKKTARRTMEQLDISESRRLRGLGERQRSKLLEVFGDQRSSG